MKLLRHRILRDSNMSLGCGLPRNMFISTIACLLFVSLCVAHDDEFHEEMFIKPLQTGHVYIHFQFTTTWDMDPEREMQHFRLFPKPLGEVLNKFSVQELHLSQTQGLWRHSMWDYPIVDAPPGAELWVWFKEQTPNVDQTWTELINVLSGMFCASLNFMDARSTVTPKMTFRPQGITTKRYEHRATDQIRYASLPSENVCTENLTPWKKLLPCGSKSGLATLFNAVKLYDASYHSLGVHFRPVCKTPDCNTTAVELSLSVSVVFEPGVSGAGIQDWTLRKLFNRMLSTTCPLASSSKAYVDTQSNKTLEYYFTLSPEPTEVASVQRGGQTTRYAVYDLTQFVSYNRVFNLAAKYNKQIIYKAHAAPVLHAQRFQTGFGQEEGGIMTLLYNEHHTEALTIVYMEVIPWFLRTYLHTLNIETFPGGKPHTGANGTIIKPRSLHYVAGKDRQRPHLLEIVVRLPAGSLTRLGLRFDRALLKWTEYPPDANHGFYVSSAVISAMLPEAIQLLTLPQRGATIAASLEGESQPSSRFIRLHTETLLVTLPTPDFSMPYNVICLACTVVAIAFGSIHNLTTRRFVIRDPSTKGFLGRLRARLPNLPWGATGVVEGEGATGGTAPGEEVAPTGDSGPTEGRGGDSGAAEEGRDGGSGAGKEGRDGDSGAGKEGRDGDSGAGKEGRAGDSGAGKEATDGDRAAGKERRDGHSGAGKEGRDGDSGARKEGRKGGSGGVEMEEGSGVKKEKKGKKGKKGRESSGS